MNRRRYWMAVICHAAALLCYGCSSPPKGLQVVEGFEADRYLGKWYEIARLDHSFERGMSRVTAEYSRNEDGSIKVVNRGFDVKKEKWNEATATAKFAGAEEVGSLKVTFFWPFTGGYHVIALDKEGYQYAMVTSYSKDYLWILAREKELDKGTLDRLVRTAKEMGFKVGQLIFVEH